MSAVGQGWYRVSASGANNSTGNTTAACYLYASKWIADGSTTGSVYAWGGQLEKGKYPSSYIPTTSVALTRNADLATIQTANDSWFNSSQGSLWAQFIMPFFAQNQFVVDLNDNTGNNRIGMYSSGSTTLVFNTIDTGVAQFQPFFSSVLTANQTSKVITAYQANNMACSINGSTATTSTTGTVPVVSQLRIGSYSSGAFYTNGWIQGVRYYNSRLSDSDLKILTTP